MKKKLVGYQDLPEEILAQIHTVTEIWKKHMGDDLVGVYLHGSIALGAFCPDSGDIDILVVVRDSISATKKLEIARDVIAADQKPRPLEMSAIKLSDAQHWEHDGNCVFHYSDFWTERYLKRFADETAELYVVDQEFPDADVTSYIRLLKESGIVLYGEPVENVFAEISDEDFWRAITADVDDYEFDNYEPRYFASNILILGRILSFKTEKRILSKYEAGQWMIRHIPEKLKYIPETAVKIWFEGENGAFQPDDLENLRLMLIREIKG